MDWEEVGFKWHNKEKLMWGEEEGKVAVEKEEEEREALIIQGPENGNIDWVGRNGCSETLRTKDLLGAGDGDGELIGGDDGDFHGDSDQEDRSLDFQEGASSKGWSNDSSSEDIEEKGDYDIEEEKDKDEGKEGMKSRRGSRSESLHFFLEQLVDEEGWRECVEVSPRKFDRPSKRCFRSNFRKMNSNSFRECFYI